TGGAKRRAKNRSRPTKRTGRGCSSSDARKMPPRAHIRTLSKRSPEQARERSPRRRWTLPDPRIRGVIACRAVPERPDEIEDDTRPSRRHRSEPKIAQPSDTIALGGDHGNVRGEPGAP